MQQYTNRLNEILTEGFMLQNFKPTDELLEKMGGITMWRFGKILNNKGDELTAKEKAGIEQWLYDITGIRFDIYEDGPEKLIRELQSA